MGSFMRTVYHSRSMTAPVQNRRQREQQNEGGSLERFIAQELANEPYELELNAASFCYMSKEELHETLDKILETVSPEKMELIYIAEDKTDQIMEFLQMLRYKPGGAEISDLEKLREGIEEADIDILIPLMAWLLANMPTLKTRAYLSKFLIKIQIPDDLLFDEDIATLYLEYEAEIEKFKKTHKLRESMAEKRPLLEIKNEILEVQQDIECLKRKAEMTKAKVAHVEDREAMVEVIRQFRSESSRQSDLLDQEAIETTRMNHIVGRMEYLMTTLNDLVIANESLTPRSLIEREQQELANVRCIVTEKLPKAIGRVRRKIRAIRTVVENIPKSINDLEETRIRVRALEGETNKLEQALQAANAKEVSRDLFIIRKKAAIVRNRRKKLTEHLKYLEENCEVTRSKLTHKSYDALTKKQRDEDDQIYVINLRAKAKLYKEKKAELNAIRVKVENLYKTNQNMDKDLGKSKQSVSNVERQQGLQEGFGALHQKMEEESSKKEKIDAKKRGMLDDYSDNVIALNNELEERKHRLKPLVQMVDAQRQQTLLLAMEHRQMKHKYEQATQNNQSQDLIDLKKVQETVQENEMEVLQLDLETKFKRFELDRANECANGNGRRRFKEKLLGKLVEQERIHRQLNEEDADLERNEAKCYEQQQMFADMIRLLKAKKESFFEDASFLQEEESEEIVLNENLE